MSRTLAEKFGVERPSPFVLEYLERGNLEVMLPMSILMSIVSAFGFVSTFLPVAFWAPHQQIIWEYRIYFVALFVISVVYERLCRKVERAQVFPGATVTRMVIFVTAAVLSLSIWITLAGYAVMSRYFFLVAALIVLFGLLCIPPAIAFSCIALSFVISLAGLAGQGRLDSAQIVTLFTYCILIDAVSGARYHARLRAGLMQERIRRGARHDELTGALNRRSLDEDAPRLVGQPLHVILADVDEFKIYNDLYGHATGDAILQCFSATMHDAFKDGNVIRYGGDEFLAILPARPSDKIDERIERWRAAFHASKIEGTSYEASCSAGICTGKPESESDLFGMIRLADMGLYQAKEGGRNACVRVPFDLTRVEETAGSTLKVSSGSSDALTGLPDADFFYAHAQQAAPVMLSRGTPIAFAYFNVGGLKEYNERFGFEQGDALLCKVADFIREAYPNRLLARIGDDRFLLMAETRRLSNTLDAVCKRVLDCQEDQVATLRAGIYRYDEPELNVRVACDRAKVACDSIRGRYDVFSYFYSPELEAESKRRQRVVERFETALSQGQIQVHYQPIVRTVSDNICDLEALARWDDPTEGMLEASSFIDALEDAGLVSQLDLHVLEEVCRAQDKLIEAGVNPIPVSVNLSANDFADPAFIDALVEILARHDLPGNLLRIEVTEQAFEENRAAATDAMARMHLLGIQIWMDNFGNSSSAMNVLRDCNFDLVKLDIQLVKGLSDPDEERADRARVLLMHIISMSKELGLHTLAEGIETLDELSFLRNVGCERLQGKIFSPAVPIETIRDGLAAGSYMAEDDNLRSYYDDMGKVNLVRPVPAGASYDPTGTANGVPVAIAEYSRLEGDAQPSLHYLTANRPFQENLEALSSADEKAYDELMGLGYGSERGLLWGKLERALESSDWLRTRIGSTSRSAYVRRIAHTKNGSATALLIFVPPVRHRQKQGYAPQQSS